MSKAIARRCRNQKFISAPVQRYFCWLHGKIGVFRPTYIVCEKTFRGLCYENTRLWKTGIDALYTYNIHTCIDCIRFFFLFFSSSDFMCSCNKIHCLKKKNQRQYQRLDVFLLPRTKYRYRYRYNYKYKYKCKYRSKYRYSYKYRYRFRYRYKWLFYV